MERIVDKVVVRNLPHHPTLTDVRELGVGAGSIVHPTFVDSVDFQLDGFPGEQNDGWRFASDLESHIVV